MTGHRNKRQINQMSRPFQFLTNSNSKNNTKRPSLSLQLLLGHCGTKRKGQEGAVTTTDFVAGQNKTAVGACLFVWVRVVFVVLLRPVSDRGSSLFVFLLLCTHVSKSHARADKNANEENSCDPHIITARATRLVRECEAEVGIAGVFQSTKQASKASKQASKGNERRG